MCVLFFLVSPSRANINLNVSVGENIKATNMNITVNERASNNIKTERTSDKSNTESVSVSYINATEGDSSSNTNYIRKEN